MPRGSERQWLCGSEAASGMMGERKEETAVWGHTSKFKFVALSLSGPDRPGCGHGCFGTKWRRNESLRSSVAVCKREVSVPHSACCVSVLALSLYPDFNHLPLWVECLNHVLMLKNSTHV